MLRPRGVGSDEGKIDFRLHQLRELDLGFFGRFLEPLDGHAVFAEIDALLFFELGNQEVDDHVIDIVATQVSIAIGGLHFHDAFAHFQDGNIEGAAAQIVHGDGFVFLFIEAVSERGGRGLVDDAQHFKPRDFAGLLGGLALAVIEICRDSDHSLGDFLTQEVLGGGFQLLKNHGGNFRWAIRFAGNFDAGIVVRPTDHFIGDALYFFRNFVIAAPHESLNRINCVFRVGDRLPLGHLPHQAFASFGDRDDRRGRARTFLVGDDNRLAALHDGDDRIGRTQVNSNNLTHRPCSSTG